MKDADAASAPEEPALRRGCMREQMSPEKRCDSDTRQRALLTTHSRAVRSRILEQAQNPLDGESRLTAIDGSERSICPPVTRSSSPREVAWHRDVPSLARKCTDARPCDGRAVVRSAVGDMGHENVAHSDAVRLPSTRSLACNIARAGAVPRSSRSFSLPAGTDHALDDSVSRAR